MFAQEKLIKPGQKFVKSLIAATLLLFAVYFALHIVVDKTFSHATTEGTLRIKKTGEVVLLDVESIVWVVGEEKATAILKRMQIHTEQIHTLLERLARQRDTLRLRWEEVIKDDVNIVTSPVDIIHTAMTEGKWRIAHDRLTEMANRYRSSSLSALVASMEQSADTLKELARIKSEQRNDKLALNPPKAKAIFWTSPHGSIIEVLFFALFGVLTNLLVSSAEYLRKGQFKEAEQWVAYTKLVYGPVLAVILIIAIIMGWFDIGDYETRAYTLPLIGFIFGYASRRTVTLFDKLTNKILGSATQSIEKGPSHIAKRRAAYLKQFQSMMVPKALPEFREQAKILAQEYIKTEVLKRESEK